MNSNLPEGWGKAVIYAKDRKEAEEALKAIGTWDSVSPLVKVLEPPSTELERKIQNGKVFKKPTPGTVVVWVGVLTLCLWILFYFQL